MFTELRSLLARRSLTIMVAAVDEDQIRVNVIPHPRPEEAKINEQIKYSHKDEVAPVPDTAIKALSTPISLTGTAEEIDENFSGVLLRFVESHTRLQATLDRASVEISEAVKAIDERNKNKPKTKVASTKPEQKDDSKTPAQDSKPDRNNSLPLWWTDSSVSPPGTAPTAAPTPTPPPADSAAGNRSENTQEVSR
jgi:PRTRC genetic system protein E